MLFSQEIKRDDLIYKYSRSVVKKGKNIVPNEIVINKNNKKKEEDLIFFNYKKTETGAAPEVDQIIKEISKDRKYKYKENAFIDIEVEKINIKNSKKDILKYYFAESLDSSSTYDSKNNGKLSIGFMLNANESKRILEIKSVDTAPVLININIEKKKKIKYKIPSFDINSLKVFLEKRKIHYSDGYLLLDLGIVKAKSIKSLKKEKCKYYFDSKYRLQKNIKNARYVFLCLSNGIRTVEILENNKSYFLNYFIKEETVTFEKLKPKKQNTILVLEREDGSIVDVEEESFLNVTNRKKPIKKSLNAYSFENMMIFKQIKNMFYMNKGGKRVKIKSGNQSLKKISLTSEVNIKKILKALDAKWNNLSCLIEIDAKEDLEYIEYGLIGKRSREVDNPDIEELDADFIVKNKRSIGKDITRSTKKIYYYFEALGLLSLKLNYKNKSSDYMNVNCLNEYVIEQF